MKLGIIGMGRMGCFLAERLKNGNSLTLITKNVSKIKDLFNEGVVSDKIEDLLKVDYIFLALPPEGVLEYIKKLEGIKVKCPIFNMSTSLLSKDINTFLKVIPLKFLGNVRECGRGARPKFFLGDEKYFNEISNLLKDIGDTTCRDEIIVKELNSFCSEEAIKTGYKIKKALVEQRLSMEDIEVGLNNVFIGTMKAYFDGDVGPFAREIIKKLE